MNRKERRAQAKMKIKTRVEAQAELREIVAELRLAARESRDPDPNNVKSSNAAGHIRFINKERLPGGDLFGTYLLGIASARSFQRKRWQNFFAWKNAHMPSRVPSAARSFKVSETAEGFVGTYSGTKKEIER